MYAEGASWASLGEEGLIVCEGDGPSHPLPAAAREVYDVSGAGDTAIAALAAGIASGLGLVEAARLANLAAGIVVGKIGTAVTHASALSAALTQSQHAHAAQTPPLPPAPQH